MKYEWLGRCQYPVFDYTKQTEVLCNEPAIARIKGEGDDDCFICREHLDFILKQELKERINAQGV